MNRYTDKLMRDYLSRTERGDRDDIARDERRGDGRSESLDERRGRNRSSRMNDRMDDERDNNRYDDRYDDNYDDSRRSRNSRGQFTDRHYEEEPKAHLSRSDMRRWSSNLKNKDGTRGPHFEKEHVRELSEKMKLEFDEYTFDELLMTMNMLYSDYCKVVRFNETEMKIAKYIEMAMAFLEDDDGYSPSDKLARYYCFVVPHE